MGDWLLNLPLPWMALVVFLATYLIAAVTCLIVTGLATGERARAFKAVSPGMLPPLGIIFGLLVGFIAVQVWSDFDKAKSVVATEASALRATILLARNLPEEQRARVDAIIDHHIAIAVKDEWPAMAGHRAKLTVLPSDLIAALHEVLVLKPADDSQRTAQRLMVEALHTGLDARRQRIVISQSAVSSVKWVALLLQGLITLVAIALVHSDNRLSCAIALGLFATGIALSLLLIGAYSRPFTGELSVSPELLQQVIPNEGDIGTR